jgi:regulator of protease activity HflC (stomatin/prohibitin superfamily)
MLIETLQFFSGIFVVVYDGQHALKFRLGRARSVVGPGVHFKWPVIEKFRVKETKDTTLDLEPQVIQLKDDLVYEVDAKIIYQVKDLAKALIEVDDLVQGLKNRATLAVQRVVKRQDRESIRDMARMVQEVREELAEVEKEWGVKVHEFGFSNFAPTPASLEITQLRCLAEEKLRLYQEMIQAGVSSQAAVALISGAVVTMPPASADGVDRPKTGPDAGPDGPAQDADAGHPDESGEWESQNPGRVAPTNIADRAA